MEPSKKTEAIEQVLTGILGKDRRENIKNDICTWCNKPATEFKDDLSMNEFAITGFCQICQDDTFD